MRIRFSLSVLLAILFALPAAAQNRDQRIETVSFPAGSTGTTITDRIRGYEYVDYRIGANADQWMTVQLDTDNTQNYFNVLAPGQSDVAFFIGSTRGNWFEGSLPESGTYTIRVYMMRAAARRDEVADYRLSISITGRQATRPQRPSRPPEGGADGPDFWQVCGLPAGDTLNMRDGPGTRYRVVLKVAEGTRLRNMGCEGTGNSRWCRVATGNDRRSGWVSGRYLVEAGAPTQLPGDALVPGMPYHATGSIDCRFGGDTGVTSCRFGVVRLGGGDARIEITFPDGFKRTLFFERRRWMSPETGEIAAARFGDETEVIVNGSERFTIPDAVMFGG